MQGIMGNDGSSLKRSLGVNVNAFFAVLISCLILGSSPSEAQTRRAFLVGVQNYSDKKIPALKRTLNDANDLAKDLEEVGLDKKNIKVANDLKNKDAFDREIARSSGKLAGLSVKDIDNLPGKDTLKRKIAAAVNKTLQDAGEKVRLTAPV